MSFSSVFEELPKVQLDNDPFPHIVIDDFFDESTAKELAEAFPEADSSWYSYDNHFEKKRAMDDVEKLPVEIQAMLTYFNTRPVVEWLESLTNIQGLIPDPWLRGGGCHQIKRGGKLDIHADFNVHPHLKLYRRLNVLYYLTPKWEESWGGHLELWATDMSTCVKRILPEFNRLVIFETNDDSYHGHPDPLNCPTWISRNSLAWYYYTSTPNERSSIEPHSTMFIKRPFEATTEEIEALRKKRNKGRLN